MRIAGEWIGREGTKTLMQTLNDAGYLALFVGGCIRNALLKLPVADVDIATDALPGEVMKITREAGMKPAPTGLDYGTVTVVSGGIPHEITTFRRDIATDGRRATVTYAKDAAEDAHRRDFTINALYARSDGTVVDPLGGLADLMARRVRFIDDPVARIREDYLRILRFFRFHAHYGDPAEGMDPEALAAIAANLDGLDRLSRERVTSELLKLLSADYPAPAVAAMHQVGALTRILPAADPRNLAPLVHIEAGRSADPIRRLAVLGGDDLGSRLRLSNAEFRRLDVLRSETGSNKTIAELAYRHDATIAIDVALLRSAVLNTALPPGAEGDADRGAAAVLPVGAADLMPGLQGPALGERLKELESLWIASDFSLTREELLT